MPPFAIFYHLSFLTPSISATFCHFPPIPISATFHLRPPPLFLPVGSRPEDSPQAGRIPSAIRLLHFSAILGRTESVRGQGSVLGVYRAYAPNLLAGKTEGVPDCERGGGCGGRGGKGGEGAGGAGGVGEGGGMFIFKQCFACILCFVSSVSLRWVCLCFDSHVCFVMCVLNLCLLFLFFVLHQMINRFMNCDTVCRSMRAF